MADAVDALVPLASVLLGAGLTYWINVRQRRRNYVEDLYAEAIAAVAVADASSKYLKSVARPDHMSEDEHRDLLGWIARTTIEDHILRAREARAAIARVIPYEPG